MSKIKKIPKSSNYSNLYFEFLKDDLYLFLGNGNVEKVYVIKNGLKYEISLPKGLKDEASW